MTKEEFLTELRISLVEAGVSPVQDIIDYYDESICDRIDSGMSEEEAVAQLGTIEEIVKNHVADMPMASVVKYRIKESHSKAKENGKGILWVILAVLGSPVWLPIMLAMAIVMLVLYAASWVVTGAFFAVDFALAAAALGSMVGLFRAFFTGMKLVSSLAGIGFVLIFAGASILMWKPVLKLAKVLVSHVKRMFKRIKLLFVR